jgi:hypothetical protein
VELAVVLTIAVEEVGGDLEERRALGFEGGLKGSC